MGRDTGELGLKRDSSFDRFLLSEGTPKLCCQVSAWTDDVSDKSRARCLTATISSSLFRLKVAACDTIVLQPLVSCRAAPRLMSYVR